MGKKTKALSGKDKHCGLIIFTSKQKLLFICLFCDQKFIGFNQYSTHISLSHNIEESSDDIEHVDLLKEEAEEEEEEEEVLEEKEFLDLADGDYQISEDIEDVVDVKGLEIRPLENFMEAIAEEDSNGDSNLSEVEEAEETSSQDHGRKNYKTTLTCEICKEQLKSKSKLDRHLEKHKRTECSDCFEQCYTISNLRNHKKEKHNTSPRYLCSDCGNSYKTQKGFKFHMLKHRNERIFKCEVCEKGFYHMRFLKDHMLLHENARAFVCSQCGASFNRSKTLHQHLKMHANKREYVCKLCGSRFNLSNGLRQHMKGKHNAK